MGCLVKVAFTIPLNQQVSEAGLTLFALSSLKKAHAKWGSAFCYYTAVS
jgi:hypothetical protein